MDSLSLLFPSWRDYELLDSGGFEKLERFGGYVLRRPEPQAIWPRALSDDVWDGADAFFRKDRGSEDRGTWILRPGMPDRWNVSYGALGRPLRMRLALTSFKHTGLFPEQAANWDYIYDRSRRISELAGRPANVLNLFAYTGGATLAARAAGAQVTHVDSVRQVVSWASDNLSLSGMDSVRWIVDDAVKFVARQVRRGVRYDGIILDPPAYGRGPDGEKWILERDLYPLLEQCSSILESRRSFIVLNLYSMGLSAVLARSALGMAFQGLADVQNGELCFRDRSGRILPLGVYCRRYSD